MSAKKSYKWGGTAADAQGTGFRPISRATVSQPHRRLGKSAMRCYNTVVGVMTYMSIHVCDHCGKPIPDDATVCLHCGAEQQEDIRLSRIPETIGELRAFCDAHHMPLERMRFFIGEDCHGARAFGIYKDGVGNCVVYKNKSDGSRAIRYKGMDEKRAVRELYEKLKSETELRRGNSSYWVSLRSLPALQARSWRSLCS